MSIVEELFAHGKEPGIPPMCDEAGEKKFPLLFDLLNRRTYADGTARCPPTIVIRRVPGGVEVVVQEHDFCCQKATQSRTLEGVFKALEKILGDTESPWRDYKSRMPTPLKTSKKGKKP